MIQLLNKLQIIGYSGHSYPCIDIAIQSNIEITGYYDLNLKNNNPYKLKYLGVAPTKNSSNLFIAIGDNKLRKTIFNSLKNYDFINLIHYNSIQSNTSVINGTNCVLMPNSVLNSLSIIHEGVIINTGAVVEHECIIESFSHIAPNATLCGNVHIGQNTFVGANSVIKQGVKIGDNVVIGSGSVIINDIPNNLIVAGNPGRIINKKK